jgi:hypothetical protein
MRPFCDDEEIAGDGLVVVQLKSDAGFGYCIA